MKNMKKILVLALAALLLVAVSVAGTVAYLSDRTDEVANTFTPTTFDINLTESGTTPWEKALVPGTTYDKDPTVTIENEDIKIWLFVEVTDTATQYLEDCKLFYHDDVDTQNKWNQGDGADVPDNVWYRDVEPSEVESIELIYGSEVTVSPDLTLATMPTSDVELSFKAYACQYDNLTAVKDAWNVAKAAPIYPAPTAP